MGRCLFKEIGATPKALGQNSPGQLLRGLWWSSHLNVNKYGGSGSKGVQKKASFKSRTENQSLSGGTFPQNM